MEIVVDAERDEVVPDDSSSCSDDYIRAVVAHDFDALESRVYDDAVEVGHEKHVAASANDEFMSVARVLCDGLYVTNALAFNETMSVNIDAESVERLERYIVVNVHILMNIR